LKSHGARLLTTKASGGRLERSDLQNRKRQDQTGGSESSKASGGRLERSDLQQEEARPDWWK